MPEKATPPHIAEHCQAAGWKKAIQIFFLAYKKKNSVLWGYSHIHISKLFFFNSSVN